MAENDVSVRTPEDEPTAGRLIAADPDGDRLTYQIVDPPKHGTVGLKAKTGEFIYTPNPDVVGVDSFTFLATDGKAQSGRAIVVIAVMEKNDPPVAQDGLAKIGDMPAVAGLLSATDPEGSPVLFRVVDHPKHGSIQFSAGSGAFVYRPGPNFAGGDYFTFVANDGSIDSNLATVIIGEGVAPPKKDLPSARDAATKKKSPPPSPKFAPPVATPPVVALRPPPEPAPSPPPVSTVMAANLSLTTPEDTPIWGRLAGSDSNGEPVSYRLQDLPMSGAVRFDDKTGAYLYEPEPNFTGRDSFAFVVTNGRTTSAPATVTIDVDPVNDPPVTLGHDAPRIKMNAYWVGQLSARDPDGDPLSFEVARPPRHGDVILEWDTGKYKYTPHPDFVGDDIIGFRATDSKLFGNAVLITMTVSGETAAQVTFPSTAEEDGWIRESGESSNLGGMALSAGIGPTALRVGDDEADRQFKSILSFDTSNLPDSAVFISATLRLRVGSITGSLPSATLGPLRVDAQFGGLGSDVSLTPSDFESTATASAAGDLDGPLAEGGWVELKLKNSGLTAINPRGPTQLRLYFKGDDDDDGAADWVGFYSGESEDPNDRPQLIIEYYEE